LPIGRSRRWRSITIRSQPPARHGAAKLPPPPGPPERGRPRALALKKRWVRHYVSPMRFLRPLGHTVFVVAFAAMAAIVLIGSSDPVRAQSTFDGSWSILIITNTGECDRAYRYGIRIARGQIIYDGEAGVTFTGHVERNGRVAAAVGRGAQSATANGRLSGDSGSGTWSGMSSTGACSGAWQAERR
jgi:hypothetical protein